jgi:uncharacterized protein (TIGR01319 family)
VKVDVLVAEIGSTTTLVNAFMGVDGDNPVLWGQGQAPTSAREGDVCLGLRQAIADLCRQKGEPSLDYAEMLATSSAAGGLKMTVHGLVYDMTVRAAKEAALGAGAVIHQVSAGLLRETDLEKLLRVKPNIIMLAGGVDHGERGTVIHNAKRILELGLATPVIYAGNVDNQEELRLLFKGSAMPLSVVENVCPRIDELNVESARAVIQDVFEEHITQAPGMDHVRDLVGGQILPTPGAVMLCAKLLYGIMGDLMVLDVGGATTDVHSVTAGSEALARTALFPEPLAKRTVEGDLGVYANMHNLVDLIGKEKLEAELGFPLEEATATYRHIPQTARELQFVELLAREAVILATERHGGRIRHVYGPTGRRDVAEGKDLTQVKHIIGTGGALTRLPRRVAMMEAIALGNETGQFLFPPKTAAILVDNDYIMASLGALSKRHPGAALKLLEKSFGVKIVRK